MTDWDAEYRRRRRSDNRLLAFAFAWAALCVAAQIIVLT